MASYSLSNHSHRHISANSHAAFSSAIFEAMKKSKLHVSASGDGTSPQ
jgi:hypothetical protein